VSAKVADRLIISAGEPFWEEEWRRFLPGNLFQEIIPRLLASASLLEVACARDAGNRLLRLKKEWLQEQW
jgi:hypothetical protein